MEMNKLSREPPSILYKYRPCDDNTKKIIAHGKIYFSTIPQLNDPFEYHFFFTEGNYHTLSEEQKILYQPEEILGSNICWLSPEKNTALFIAEMRKYQGVFCLSESKKSIYMYAHYANSFKGLCLGFDSEIFRGHPSLRPMDYSKGPYKIAGGDASRADWIKVLSTKSNVFRQEKEWRIVDTAGELVKEHPFLILSCDPSTNLLPKNLDSGFAYNKTASGNQTKLWFFEQYMTGEVSLEPLNTDSIENIHLNKIVEGKPSFPEIAVLSNAELRLLNKHNLSCSGKKFPNKPMSLDPVRIKNGIREIIFGYRASEEYINFVIQELSEVKPKFYVATPAIGKYGLNIKRFINFDRDLRFFQKIFG